MSFNHNKIEEHCGIIGISCNDFSYSVANSIYTGLMAIQHRGQLFSGISTTNSDGKITTYKDFGLVSNVFKVKKIKFFSGNVGIGHVAYGSLENSNIDNAQPYYHKSDLVEFSLALNGTITNFNEIKERLINMGKVFISNSDVELIVTMIETFFRSSESMLEALKLLMNIVKGAFCLVLLTNEGELYVMRDPIGYKPLCYGIREEENRKFFIVSSESCAIDAMEGILKGDIKPGEIVNFHPLKGLKKYQILSRKRHGICQYEFVYFARPDSIINGISVADVRYRLGINLAQSDLKFNPDNTIVVPVPDSGRSAAMGYAWGSKIPYQEGLMKNRYLWQIKSDPNEKLNPVKPIVEGKEVILVDDSMISGVTMKKIILMLRKAGAVAIHVRIACPPIVNSCQINSSFSNKELLIAYQKRKLNRKDLVDEICNDIQANSLKFQTNENLIKSIGLKKKFVCYACVEDKILKKEKKVIELIQ